MTRSIGKFLLAAAALWLSAVAGFAQQAGTAGVYGAVSDPQGASVPGAKITLLDLARNQKRTALANEQGQYAFPQIPIGAYQLSVEHPGFRTFEQTNIELAVNDNRRVDVTMQLGEATTKVTVSAATAQVETASATLKTVVDGKRILELPLNGRNVLQLGLLVPGAVNAGGANTGTAKSPADNQNISINGSRQNNVRFTLDGGDNSDNLTNVNAPYPFPDAVEEFSVQTSNAGPEMGRNSAGSVNVVTKGGGNAFHASAFWFVRNAAVNAGSYFLHQTDNLKRNQGGATAGGRIIRDKLFFFGGVQRTWIRTIPTESRALTMTEPHRQGNFSDLLRLARPVQLTDPTNNQPFAGNIIPSNRLSPAAQNLLQYSPLPGPDGFTRWRSNALEDPKEYVLRIDWRPSARHNILGRYLQNSDLNTLPFDPKNLHSVANTQSSFSKNATLGYTFVATPALMADTHFTVSRTVGLRSNDFPKTIADFGVNVHPSSNQISVGISGTSGLSLSTVNPPASFARTNLEATHAWRWVRGSHNFAFGGELSFSRYNEYNFAQGSGSYSFNGRFSGNDQADYVLGLLSSFTQSNGEIEFRRLHYQALYAGDTFRVNRRLTLNYGLRWEPYTPLTDLNDRQVQFRPDAYRQGAKSTRYSNAPKGLFYPGDQVNGETIPKAGVASSKLQLAPRVGLAWDITGNGKSSLRVGYGIFYDTPSLYMLNNMNLQSPFSFNVTFNDGLFDDPYRGRANLNVFPFSGDFDRNSPFQSPFRAIVYQARWNQPYVQNWNVTLQRAIGQWSFQAGYVGAKATHLLGNTELNAPVYAYDRTLAQNLSTIQARRPLQDFQSITAIMTDLNSNYHSLQVQVLRRFARDFTVQTAYTVSKAIDTMSTNDQVTSDNVWNPSDYRMMRGVSDFDRAQRFTSSIVWELPKPGKKWNSRALGTVTDGWQLSGMYNATGGAPMSFTSTNSSMASAGTSRADLVGVLQLPTDRSRGELINQYFNTTAVAQAQPGSWGNLGRNVLRGPGSSGTSASLTRAVPLRFREGANLQFRTEFFGLFNHPQLGQPDNRLGRSTFGTISGVGGQRVLQFALKMAF